MRILIVHSGNVVKEKSQNYSFVYEQGMALMRMGHQVDFFSIQGHGIIGYLKNLSPLKQNIANFQPTIIHVHYGLCGLLCNLQRRIPVITTYHGSDINNKYTRWLSMLSIYLSAWNIFVSQRIANIAHPGYHYTIQPNGIKMPKLEKKLTCMEEIQSKLTPEKKHILFAGAFDNTVKNYPLAKAVVDLIPEAELIELKGYTREQVWALMYACDAFLMTSFTEGSPQVIKEAMACGCPIVSVDVGDVAERLEGLEGCYVVNSRNPQELADKLRLAIQFGRTKGAKRIFRDGLTNDKVAIKLVAVYREILSKQS